MIKTIDRADGTRYQVYGRRNGRKVYVSTHETRRAAVDADERFRVTQRQIKAGELPAELDGKRLLGPSLETWLDAIAAMRGHGAYKSRLENHVMPTLRSEPLAQVTTEKLKRLCVGLKAGTATKTGKPVSRSTIDGVLAALGSAWGYFTERQWVRPGSNPITALTRRRGGKGALDRTIGERVKPTIEWISDPADITKLIGACGENIRTLVVVLVGTGIRLDEALHLEWSDIDLDRRTILVRRGRKGTPKSGKARTVPILHKGVLGVLREMKVARGGNVLLWPSPKRGKDNRQRARNQSGVFRSFKAALVRAGLPEKLRVHDLRHTFAGQYLSTGGDIYRLSKILGHHSVAITTSTYAHLRADVFEQDYERMSFEMPSGGAKVIAMTGR